MTLVRTGVVLLAALLPLWCVSDSALAANNDDNTPARAKLMTGVPGGAITPARDVDWWYGPCVKTGMSDKTTFTGTLLAGRRGLKVTVYHPKVKGATATTVADLVLVKSHTFRAGSPPWNFPIKAGYFYYLEFKAAKAGQTGTYVGHKVP